MVAVSNRSMEVSAIGIKMITYIAHSGERLQPQLCLLFGLS